MILRGNPRKLILSTSQLARIRRAVVADGQASTGTEEIWVEAVTPNGASHLSAHAFLDLCLGTAAAQGRNEDMAHLALCPECAREHERLEALGVIWDEKAAGLRQRLRNLMAGTR